jgi:hypothetical protein
MAKSKRTRFPTGRRFLDLAQTLADHGSKATDKFFVPSGNVHPKTLTALGDVLSIPYRLGSCAYGCRGGDHQIEWLVGKQINQAVSAHRLIRAGQYDEALMLIRGIGEIANLLWLFRDDKTELTAWKAADEKTRVRQFGPAKVRQRLERHSSVGPLIDSKRYQALCEIGTHPTPGLAPGHYTGKGPPIVGAIPQTVGILTNSRMQLRFRHLRSPDCNSKLRKRIADQSVRFRRKVVERPGPATGNGGGWRSKSHPFAEAGGGVQRKVLQSVGASRRPCPLPAEGDIRVLEG